MEVSIGSFKRLLMIGVVSLTISVAISQTNQPYSSYWFIDGLLEWDKETDPHAKFNISYTPLQERFADSTTQIRPELNTDPGIVALISSHATSNHPSQGFETIKQYALPYWQYIDYMVQWGGSSGEGIIVTPAKPWIDAAHKNGVKILGTVFFPPNVYGGKEEWVRDFLQKNENGNFPVADKLIEVADYYHFDGWFINQETHGMGVEEAKLMQELMIYYQEKSELKMMWYDAMIEDGRVIWQDEFNDHNAIYFQQGEKELSDIMFIDFGWSVTDLEDSRKKVEALGRSSWDLYAGIDVQSRGYKSYANWDALYDENDQPYTTSVGIYWLSSTFGLSETKEPEEVYQNEMQFWNGGYRFKPKWGREIVWKGFTNFFPARSVIQEAPFVTNFNYGLGRFFNIEGKQVSNSEWHNLSTQDILPTWQWQVDTTIVKAGFDFEDSYTGGSCIQFEVNGVETIPLYKMNTSIEKEMKLIVASKVDDGASASIIGLFSDGSEMEFFLDISSDWKKEELEIGSKSGLAIKKISISVEGQGIVKLGQLGVVGKTEQLTKVRAIAKRYVGSDEVYISINGSDKEGYYDIFSINPDRSENWLSRTKGKDIYLSGIGENVKKLKITQLSKDQQTSKTTIIPIK